MSSSYKEIDFHDYVGLLKIPIKEIELATNNFADENLLKHGTSYDVYKGQLLQSGDLINIVARKPRQLSMAVNEAMILKDLKHKNIISIFKLAHTKDEGIIINRYEANESLEKHLSSPTLTWIRRLLICVGVAHALGYLHYDAKENHYVIHGNIKSSKILLDHNWEPKLHGFIFAVKVRKHHLHLTSNYNGSLHYMDPSYEDTKSLNHKSDIFSFGVLLFEVLCGREASIPNNDNWYFARLARSYYEEGKLDDLIDPNLQKQMNLQSFDIFAETAYCCIKEQRSQRPDMNTIRTRLEKALELQQKHEQSTVVAVDGTTSKHLKKTNNNFHVSHEAIKAGTQNFSDYTCVGEGRLWKLYEGEVTDANGCAAIFAKRWDNKSHQGHIQFLTELKTLLRYKHENLIGLIGYCNEKNEKIIIYEHACNGSLAKHLDNPSLTWMKRLKICIDVATGLKFLHEGGVGQEDCMMHRDIRSGSILLDCDWNAKISNLEFSSKVPERAEHVDDNAYISLGYIDPEYEFQGFLSSFSDIYSLGVILFEMLCGRLACAEGCEDHSQSLGPLAVRYYNEEGNLDNMIFDGIKEQITPPSLTTFQTIAIQCLEVDMFKRPTITQLITQLKKALEFQEDYEIWEPKLPIDYKEIIESSKTPYIYNDKMKKDLYDMLSKGILLQDDKVLFSLGSNGERNEMISAKRFSYKNHLLRKWRSLPESRFPKVAKMLCISNLNIRIKIRTQFLSPCVNYKVHLIFKLRGRSKSQAKQMYVNLKYKMGNESLNAYFATWREDGWMMIQLFQFFNHKKDTDFEVLLESFSRCYCGSDSVYIDGILFQAIDNVKQGEIEKSKEVQQVSKSRSETDKFLPRMMHYIKKIVHNSSNVEIQSRFDMDLELPQKQVFHIKCKISSKMLSAHTENVCYLVFKLSEKRCGLHGPVIVRDQFHWRSKEKGILYFRSPNPCNIHETDWIPKKREDGWMEVILWKYNSSNCTRIDDHLFVNLKLVTYEGTMSGLIARGIDFRPI